MISDSISKFVYIKEHLLDYHNFSNKFQHLEELIYNFLSTQKKSITKKSWLIHVLIYKNIFI